jgi:hypothetical protein
MKENPGNVIIHLQFRQNFIILKHHLNETEVKSKEGSMRKFALTIVYILVVVFAVNFFRAEGNTNTVPDQISLVSSENNFEAQKNNPSFPMLLSSGPVKSIPEPISFSLFGFGFFIVVGIGWIKKSPEQN